MPLGVSVVICCHNSAERLPNTLAHLAAQQVRADVPWEAIVVDNASTDETAKAAAANWPKVAPVPLRVVHEPQSGLSHARIKGFAEARQEIVCFIDDDNWVCPEWVQVVSDLMAEHPDVGACGGQGEAVCEVDPPPWFEKVKGNYAVGLQGPAAGDVTSTRGYLWGAGLAIRKVAWEQILATKFEFSLSGGFAVTATTGEDTELCFALRLASWRLWFEPRLRFKHFLPASRLNWAYQRRSNRAYGASEVVLDAYQFARKGGLAKRKGRFLQNVWLRQVIIEVKAILQYRSKLLRAPWQSMEGDPDVLDIERLAGKIRELLRTRRSYEQRLRMVDHLTALGSQ